jgi:hypothetical protein
MRPLVFTQQALHLRHGVNETFCCYKTSVVYASPESMESRLGYPKSVYSVSPELMRLFVVMQQALFLRHHS